MNAIMERWICSCRRELLDRTLIHNQTHLLHALREYEHFYNTHRPHQALGMATPTQRFHAATDPPLPAQPPLVVAHEPTDPSARRPRPGRAGEIARLVHSNGVIVVTRQVCSVGRRYAGQQVTVQVEPNQLHVFCDGVYLKTIGRTTTEEVTQVRAHRRNNHRPVR